MDSRLGRFEDECVAAGRLAGANITHRDHGREVFERVMPADTPQRGWRMEYMSMPRRRFGTVQPYRAGSGAGR